MNDAALQRLLDEAAIRRLACQYAKGVDEVDGALLAGCFTEDGVLEGSLAKWQGREALSGLPANVRGRYLKTFHAVHNQVVEIESDRATATTYCTARHLLPAPAGNHFNYEMTIRYDDELVRLGDEWKFSRRVLHVIMTSVGMANPGE